MGYISVSHMTSRNWITDCKETKVKIDPDRLRTLRQRKKLSRPELERVSGITVRTIQRLENEPDECKTTRDDTVIRLANALDVGPGVLTGELDMPDADEAQVAEPDSVRIGAEIEPKVRLAYDLIKRRYGVNTTDLINMAPLFFALLAEGSLARRREELKEAREASPQLDQIDEYWRGGLGTGFYDAVYHGIEREEESIRTTDLFGERLLDDPDSSLLDSNLFNPDRVDLEGDNPFAGYLRKLADELAIPGIVNVDVGELDFELDFRFPKYEVWPEELSYIVNGSRKCRLALEFGLLRVSEIPDNFMAGGMDKERQEWIEDRISEKLKDSKNEIFAPIFQQIEKWEASQSTSSETEEGGDDQ